MSTLPDALLLAELHGIEYLQIDAPVVLAVVGEARHFYCLAAEWSASPVAQEATRLTRIAALEAEITQLKAQGPALAAPKGKRGKKPKPVVLPPPSSAPAPTEPAPVVAAAADIAAIASLACPHCEFTAANPVGLKVHLARRHKAAPAAEPIVEPPPAPTPATPRASAALLATVRPPAEPSPVELLAANERFVCSQCGSTAFASAISNPEICIRCDAASKRAAAAD